MSFKADTGAVITGKTAHEKPLSAKDLDALFRSLSEHLMKNEKYKLPGNKPFQTIIVVHGGVVFVKLIGSRDTTFDIDFLAAYTDALLEEEGLMDPIEKLSQSIEAIGKEKDLGNSWMNFDADKVIEEIADGLEEEGEDP
jgi:hypothetical protein